MKALLALVVVAGTATAEPLPAIVRDRLAPAMPAGLDVAKLHLPAALAKLDVEPSRVAVEVPRELRAGRSSIKVTVRGRPAQYVPVTIAALSAVAVAQRELAAGAVITPADIAIEQRAVDGLTPAAVAAIVGGTVSRTIAVGDVVGKADVVLPPPLARGTQISVAIRRGSVVVRGTATLELAARPGEAATARLAHTRTLVRGTLVAPSTLVVGEP